MNPEVFYFNVIVCVNRQKRELFRMVVKAAWGSTFIGNATFIPSGKKWVFLKKNQYAFVALYGNATISRNHLCLTDKDFSEFGPLDNCIATMTVWSFTMHTLCVFHALSKRYKELVHPHLPRMRSNKKLLTRIGEIYVKCFL